MNPETELLKAILKFLRISPPQPWIRIYRAENGGLFKFRIEKGCVWASFRYGNKQLVIGVGKYDIPMTLFIDLTK
jgi:hypothetical protein